MSEMVTLGEVYRAELDALIEKLPLKKDNPEEHSSGYEPLWKGIELDYEDIWVYFSISNLKDTGYSLVVEIDDAILVYEGFFRFKDGKKSLSKKLHNALNRVMEENSLTDKLIQTIPNKAGEPVRDIEKEPINLRVFSMVSADKSLADEAGNDLELEPLNPVIQSMMQAEDDLGGEPEHHSTHDPAGIWDDDEDKDDEDENDDDYEDDTYHNDGDNDPHDDSDVEGYSSDLAYTVSNLKWELESERKKVEELEKELDRFKNLYKEQGSTLMDSQRLRAESDAKVTKLQETLNERDAEVSILNEQISVLVKKLDATNATVLAKDSKIEHLKQYRVEDRKEIERLTQERSALLEARDDLVRKSNMHKIELRSESNTQYRAGRDMAAVQFEHELLSLGRFARGSVETIQKIGKKIRKEM